ncbi:hypothetical protein CHARACLAT_013445 [Characodon lateralis]|uniref:Uncharacterized protein n=1 Tax=Characodon lateralis TaxID=208331 RepID=A0ABU7F356_9TELE|nr:hypothetical protein [Characodon lateralis]
MKTTMLFFDDKPITSVPIRLPGQPSYTTHRTVTPVLPVYEKASSLKSHLSRECPEWDLSHEHFSLNTNQFLIPPDHEPIFSSQQTLEVYECSQASSCDLSPVSPAFSAPSPAQFISQDTISRESEVIEFSPGFRRVLSEFETTVSEFESNTPNIMRKKPSKVVESPHPSDSDLEFFDCQQEFSEPEHAMPENEITHHIFEPPSPRPRRSLDMGLLKDSPACTNEHFLQVEVQRRLSSGSESLGEFAYDSDVSRDCAADGGLPACEELPSRGQAEYYDDDDFLGMVRG